MRLLYFDPVGGLNLTRDLTDHIPPYAILSHTWGADEDEIKFSDIGDGQYKNKAGYAKLGFCGQQARHDGLEHFWVDTCCIDKSSSAELAEAIVSMFKWYGRAARCYAYLSDVSTRKRKHDTDDTQASWEAAFRASRWFTRGWTLQELLAPVSVDFFTKEGHHLGDRKSLEQIIHEVTTIPKAALRGESLDQFSHPERLRWGENRVTTRKEDKAYSLQGIFGVHMSPLYGEEENAFDRLKDVISASLRRQLDTLEQAPVNLRVTPSRSNGAAPMPLHSERKPLREHCRKLLASLMFEQMESRQSTIKSAYSTTCQWLVKHPAYLEWNDDRQTDHTTGVLWISGKPGAGKSTLVKFIHAHAIKARVKHEIVVSFFFNARGDNLERSTLGMYLSLLHQLLTQAPDLQALLGDLHPLLENASQVPTWTIESLCELLIAAVKRLGKRELIVIIDALDECDEQQIQDMALVFEDLEQTALNAGSRLRVCFASRHYPTINIRSKWKLVLEKEDGHAEDLEKYVQRHLLAEDGTHVEDVRKQVLQKANGIFIWVVLVVDILNAEFRRGRIFAVQQRLSEIPEKLSDLFKEILRRDTDNLDDLLLCLQWLIFAKRPLSREEFYLAMVSSLNPGCDSITEWTAERVTTNDIDKFVLSSSKGLAELTKSKQPTVQFIHESVRDFLIKDNGLCELWPDLGTEIHSVCQDRLKQSCQNYLSIDRSGMIEYKKIPKAKSVAGERMRRRLSRRFPFLEYATRYILHHADEAAEGISQNDFLRHFPTMSWVEISNLFKSATVHRHSSSASLLYLLAEHGHARLIRTHCEGNPTMGTQGERHHYPLFAALTNGHRDAARALLSPYCNSSVGEVVAELEVGKAFSARETDTPLFWAIRSKHEALARGLIKHSDTFICHPDQGKDQVLMCAVENNCETVVELLLDDGADVNSKDKSGWTALHEAVQKGSHRVVEPILDRGANVTLKDVNGRTDLYQAAAQDSKTLIGLLIDRGADVNVKDVHGKTALHWAAQNGIEDTVRLLLSNGADVNLRDKNGATALHQAAGYRSGLSIRQPLNRRIDIDIQNVDGGTALQVATSRSRGKVVQALLDEGGKPNLRNNDGRTALHYAAMRSCTTTVKLLLDYGADAGSKDVCGRTPYDVSRGYGRSGVTALLSSRTKS